MHKRLPAGELRRLAKGAFNANQDMWIDGRPIQGFFNTIRPNPKFVFQACLHQ
jgi:hypothetical protein